MNFFKSLRDAAVAALTPPAPRPVSQRRLSLGEQKRLPPGAPRTLPQWAAWYSKLKEQAALERATLESSASGREIIAGIAEMESTAGPKALLDAVQAYGYLYVKALDVGGFAASLPQAKEAPQRAALAKSTNAASQTASAIALPVKTTVTVAGMSEPPQSALSALIFDALFAFDVANAKWGAGVSFLTGRSVTAGSPAVILTERSREANAAPTLQRYFKLTDALPNSVPASGAIGALDTAFGKDAWRPLLLNPLENHPTRSQGKLAAALLAQKPHVAAMITRVLASRVDATAPGVQHAPGAARAAAVDLLARYESLSGSAAAAFFKAHSPAIKRARAVAGHLDIQAKAADIGAKLLAEYDVLCGEAAADFYKRHSQAINGARARVPADVRKANFRAAAVEFLARYDVLSGAAASDFYKANAGAIQRARQTIQSG